MKLKKKPTLLISLIPIIFLSLLLSINVIHYGDLASTGPNQMALFLSALVAGAIGIFLFGVSFSKIEKNIIQTIALSLQAILILLIVGALVGTWIISGIVPSIVVYGLKFLTPKIFLPMSALISFIVAMATGASWSATGTIGIALMGVGEVLGIPSGIIAGSILSGAYLGDKISPLSDATNLIIAVVQVDMVDHIKYALKTAIPSFLISLSIFWIIGLFFFADHPTHSANDISEIISTIHSRFNITPFLFTAPLIVIIMVAKKINPLMALSVGVIIGGFFALIFQHKLLVSLTDSSHPRQLYSVLISAAYQGSKIKTGNELVDSLFSRGGMREMLNTIWIIISAMVFTGIMSETKMLKTLGDAVLKGANSLLSVTMRTTLMSIFTNVIACDQYLSLVIPGKILRPHYQEKEFSTLNLSRTLGDSGAVTSCLIPWNSCGAYQSAILGVSTFTYFPYCFFSFISPVVTILFAYMGWTKVNSAILQDLKDDPNYVKELHAEDVILTEDIIDEICKNGAFEK